jgi:hypothetical protein
MKILNSFLKELIKKKFSKYKMSIFINIKKLSKF